MEDSCIVSPLRSHQSTVRLAILECDIPLEKAKAMYQGYGEIFKSLLHASAAGSPIAKENLEISIWDIQNDHPIYPEQSSIDAILITGSKHDAFEDIPWINELVRYVAQALTEGRIRVIGVCFGHQIAGRALGAPVGRNTAWEAGVLDVPLTRTGKRIFQRKKLALHLMHQDVVFKCPPGVKLLGATDVCAVQGMFVSRKLLTVQGHPEVNEEIMTEVVNSRYNRGKFTKEQWLSALEEVRKPHDGVVVGQAFLRFLYS